MKKIIQIAAIILFTLLFSTVYTYAASDHSPLNTYKHPLVSKLNQMELLFEEFDAVVKQQKEEKAEQLKEQQEQEITKLVKKEKAAVIEEIRAHHFTLEKQLELFNNNPGVEMMKEFEREKAVEIEQQLNSEIADYLSDMLLENNK